MCFSMIFALNPDKMHGDLAHAAARQRFRSDGKRRPMAHDARSRTSCRVRDAVRPDGTCRSDGLIMTGGHAPGVRVYLGSGVLQSAVADFFAQKKPVGDFGTDPTGHRFPSDRNRCPAAAW